MDLINFALIGGDKRTALLADMLGRHGSCMHYLKNGENDLPDKIAAQAVVLPVPCSFDGVFINSAEHSIPLADICSRVRCDTVLGGRMPEEAKSLCRANGARVYDLLEDEALLIKNAQLTAEGALGIIINETKRAVFGARIMILGYGRVGRALARILVPLGAKVTAAARSPAQLVQAECDGCTPIFLANASDALREMQVICNTAPAQLLANDALSLLGGDTLFIELASGGFNAESVQRAGVRFINAQGLPGKTAPESAAIIIYDRILDLLKRQI
ncbi:MAG: hypothetical protein IJF74_03610 [Clostridia bacterium]|nr:hypothetical protein [Clostridia bacterium]